jgi:hypothetical protein
VKFVHLLLVVAVTAPAIPACQRDVDGAPCPCAAGAICCPQLRICHPKSECRAPEVSPAWRWLDIESRNCGSLIDDLEDGSGVICQGSGRVGAWYLFNDGLGTQWPRPTPGTPTPPSRNPSDGSLFAMASTFSHDPSARGNPDIIGALVGVDLQFDGTYYGAYDASAYEGITFRARSKGSSSVAVRINTVDTTLEIFGGSCERDPCPPAAETTVAVTDDWKIFNVPFPALPDGACAAWTCDLPTRRITNIQFQFVEGFADHPVEFWVDDLAFTLLP